MRVSAKTLEGLRGTLWAWSLHGEFIHGGLALPFLFRSFCLERGAHLEEEGRTWFLQLLTRRGDLIRWRWGLLHEDSRRRPLALLVSSLEQHSPMFYWRDSSAEEGAWLWQAVCHLEGFLAIRIPWCQLQSDHNCRTVIPVEGIYILASQLDSGADLAVSEGAHHRFGHLAVWAWISSSFWSSYCTRFLLYFCLL